MTALRLDCKGCEWSTVIRREDVSEYAESGVGTTVKEVARTLKRDHRLDCSRGEYHLPKVTVERGDWDAWSQEFQKTGVVPSV